MQTRVRLFEYGYAAHLEGVLIIQFFPFIEMKILIAPLRMTDGN